MSMIGISNSYNNYVTQNTNDTTKKNVAKSNSRQVEFKENNDVAISKIAISFNEDGSTTMFAELEKMSKQQRDHIEAAREKRAEEKKSVEKKAAQKEQEPVKRTIVSASSMDELIAKINEVDWNKVKEESNIGSRFDFSV